MSLDAGQMPGLLLVSANRQTGGTIVTRAHVFWRGCPVGKNWAQKGLAKTRWSSPVCFCIPVAKRCRLQTHRETDRQGKPLFNRLCMFKILKAWKDELFSIRLYNFHTWIWAHFYPGSFQMKLIVNDRLTISPTPADLPSSRRYYISSGQARVLGVENYSWHDCQHKKKIKCT